MTVHQYVLSRRIQRARDLLSYRRYSLADIAIEAGFPNQSHFHDGILVAGWPHASRVSR